MKISDSTFGLKDGDLKTIVDVLRQYKQISSALIFGSRAIGNYKPGSDIDIAIKGKNCNQITHRVHGQLNEEAPLPYKLDIVLYESDNLELQKHIDEFGVIIFEQQEE